MTNHLILKFATSEGTTQRIRVPHSQPGVSDSVVRTSMQNMQNSGAIHGRHGTLIALRGAAQYQVNVTTFNVA